MLRYVFLFVGVLAFINLPAQITNLDHQVIATTGSSHAELSSTVGEVVVQTVQSGSVVLSQGFQQPDGLPLVFSGILFPKLLEVDYQLYPNPAQHHINLVLTAPEFLELHLKVMDISGRQVIGNQTLRVSGSHHTELDVSALAEGEYVLHLVDTDGNLAKAIRFRRVN